MLNLLLSLILIRINTKNYQNAHTNRNHNLFRVFIFNKSIKPMETYGQNARLYIYIYFLILVNQSIDVKFSSIYYIHIFKNVS